MDDGITCWRRDRDGAAEFWVAAPEPRWPALRAGGFAGPDGGWVRRFPAVGYRLDQAWANFRWQSRTLRVPPLHLQRAVSARRGLTARVALIDALLG